MFVHILRRYDIANATSLQLTFNASVTGGAVPAGFAERFIHSEVRLLHPHSIILAYHVRLTPKRSENPSDLQSFPRHPECGAQSYLRGVALRSGGCAVEGTIAYGA
jgi:hypothetical protein